MQELLNTLMVIFSLVGVVAIFSSFFAIIGSLKANKCKKNLLAKEESLEEIFSQLKNDKEPEIQGAAFVKMMNRGEILLHTLKNKGNCYNDKIQPELYRNSLSPQCIKALFELEGKNAGY